MRLGEKERIFYLMACKNYCIFPYAPIPSASGFGVSFWVHNHLLTGGFWNEREFTPENWFCLEEEQTYFLLGEFRPIFRGFGFSLTVFYFWEGKNLQKIQGGSTTIVVGKVKNNSLWFFSWSVFHSAKVAAYRDSCNWDIFWLRGGSSQSVSA